MKKVVVGVLVGSLVLTQFTGAVYAKENDAKKNNKYSKQDKDSNGINDAWQSKYHLGFGKDLASKDNDKDGLSNLVEYQLNLNPTLKDSDKDKITDGDEDNDKDGLTNLQELKAKLNPLSSDSDNDGIKDSSEDNDKDSLNTKEEFVVGTSPISSDSDKNGISDGAEDKDIDSLNNKSEVQLGYNLLIADSDKDGIIDGNEDKDTDGLDNKSEIQLGYNPLSADSDKDGINDGSEDSDKDGIANKQEIKEMHIKIVNSEDKKVSIQYESRENKYKVKDEIGLGDVKSLLGNLTLTPDMTKDEVANQVIQALKINDIIEYNIEVNFQNGKEIESKLKSHKEEKPEKKDNYKEKNHKESDKEKDHKDND